MSFDPKCYELAEYFLPATAKPEEKSSLAFEIQNAVEDWLEEARDITREEYPDNGPTDPWQTSAGRAEGRP